MACDRAGGLIFFALPPGPAFARGTLVAAKDDFRPPPSSPGLKERQLYLMLGNGEAMRCPVGVGRPGMQWSGKIKRQVRQADSAPPNSIKRASPWLPRMIPGGSLATRWASPR